MTSFNPSNPFRRKSEKSLLIVSHQRADHAQFLLTAPGSGFHLSQFSSSLFLPQSHPRTWCFILRVIAETHWINLTQQIPGQVFHFSSATHRLVVQWWTHGCRMICQSRMPNNFTWQLGMAWRMKSLYCIWYIKLYTLLFYQLKLYIRGWYGGSTGWSSEVQCKIPYGWCFRLGCSISDPALCV